MGGSIHNHPGVAAPSVLLIGVGAMGGVISARLIQAGTDVTIVAGPRIAPVLNEAGIELLTGDGSHRVSCEALSDVDEVPSDRRFDIVLIVTKALDAQSAAKQALSRTTETTMFVAMQNGIVEPKVAEIVGAERVIPSLLNWAATMHCPGVYEQTVSHATVLGEHDGSMSNRIQALQEVLEPVAPVTLSRNILGAQWAKLQMNCSVTALGAVTGVKLGALLRQASGRRVFMGVCREVLDVADAAGVVLERLSVDPNTPRTSDVRTITSWLDDVLIHYGATYPSILQDLKRGKPTEIDVITGYVADLACELGIRAPLCHCVTQMIHEIERGERRSELSNIDEIDRYG